MTTLNRSTTYALATAVSRALFYSVAPL